MTEYRLKTVEDTDTGDIGTIVDETEDMVGILWPDSQNVIDYRPKSSIEEN